MMLTTAEDKSEIVVRSYDSTIGRWDIVQAKIRKLGKPIGFLNDLLAKSIDEMNQANGTKLALDYGHCIIGLSEELPSELSSRDLLNLNQRASFSPTPSEKAGYKIYLSELDTLKYDECSHVEKIQVF